MTRTILHVFSFFIVCAILFSACRQRNEDQSIPSDGAVTESNDAQLLWDNALKMSEDALDQNGQMTSTRVSSSQILGCTQTVLKKSISEGNFIGMITIDFGTSYRNACLDGKTRRGQLIVKYTGRYRDKNTVVQITTNNYYVNNAKIEGRRTVSNIGNSVYNVVDSGLDGKGYSKITTIDGNVTTWKSARTRTWSEGSSTPLDFNDDVYIVNGNGDGTSSAGDVFTANANNIKLKLACYAMHMYTPVSGVLTIQSSSGSRFIDYGVGDCDRIVVFTSVTGKTYTLNL